MSVGTKIKKMRELRNYTQSYMSESLNMSLSGYSKIERDETEISLKRLKQIADILQTTIDAILSFDENKIFNIEQQQHSNGVQNGYVHMIKNENPEILIQYIEQLKNENKFLKTLIDKK